jgi:hypothetical protein
MVFSRALTPRQTAKPDQPFTTTTFRSLFLFLSTAFKILAIMHEKGFMSIPVLKK